MAASRVVAWSLLVAAVASIDLSLLAARPAGSFAGSADMLASVVLRPPASQPHSGRGIVCYRNLERLQRGECVAVRLDSPGAAAGPPPQLSFGPPAALPGRAAYMALAALGESTALLCYTEVPETHVAPRRVRCTSLRV